MNDEKPLLQQLLAPDDYARLSDFYGGAMLAVPTRPHSGSKLARIISLEGVQAVVAMLGGMRVYVPRADEYAERARRQKRNEQIRRMRQGGATMAELATRFGVTDRQIRKILNRRNTP